jgi:copper(I)-binding protein
MRWMVAAAAIAMITSCARPELNAVEVRSLQVRVAPAGARAAAAYATIVNHGSAPDTLTGVASNVSTAAGVHRYVRGGAIMTMEPVPFVEIPAGDEVRLAPGAMHVMLEGLGGALEANAPVTLTFTFAVAGPVTVSAHAAPTSGDP